MSGDGKHRTSGGADTSADCKIIFFFGGNRAGAGYFQNLRPGFLCRDADFGSDELYGNSFLYHERLLSGGKGDKNPVHADRGALINPGGNHCEYPFDTGGQLVGNKGKKVKGAKESRQQKGSEKGKRKQAEEEKRKGQKKTGGRRAAKRAKENRRRKRNEKDKRKQAEEEKRKGQKKTGGRRAAKRAKENRRRKRNEKGKRKQAEEEKRKGQKKTGGRKAVKREQKKGGRTTSFLVRVWRAGFANLLQKLFL